MNPAPIEDQLRRLDDRITGVELTRMAADSLCSAVKSLETQFNGFVADRGSDDAPDLKWRLDKVELLLSHTQHELDTFKSIGAVPLQAMPDRLKEARISVLEEQFRDVRRLIDEIYKIAMDTSKAQYQRTKATEAAKQSVKPKTVKKVVKKPVRNRKGARQ